MKKNILTALGLLTWSFYATAEPITVAAKYPIPSGTSVPERKAESPVIVSVFNNEIAVYAIAADPQKIAAILAGISPGAAAQSLIPPGSMKDMEATQAAEMVKKLVRENPALIAEIVALALGEMQNTDALGREMIIQFALSSLSGPQSNMEPMALVLALLASNPDAEANAAALIAAKNALVANDVIPADSSILEEALVAMGVLQIAPTPGELNNAGNGGGTGDQGAGDVGSVPSGGSGGGGGGSSSPSQPAPVS